MTSSPRSPCAIATYAELVESTASKLWTLRRFAEVLVQQQPFPYLEGAGFTKRMGSDQRQFKETARAVDRDAITLFIGQLSHINILQSIWRSVVEDYATDVEGLGHAGGEFADYVQGQVEQHKQTAQPLLTLLDDQWTLFEHDHQGFQAALAADATEHTTAAARAQTKIDTASAAINDAIEQISDGYDSVADGGTELVTGPIGFLDLADAADADNVRDSATAAAENTAWDKGSFMISGVEAVSEGSADVHDGIASLRENNALLVQAYHELAALKLSFAVGKAIGTQANQFRDAYQPARQAVWALGKAWDEVVAETHEWAVEVHGLDGARPIFEAIQARAKEWVATEETIERVRRSFLQGSK